MDELGIQAGGSGGSRGVRGGHGPPQTIRIQHAKISDNVVNTKYSMQTLSTTVCFT